MSGDYEVRIRLAQNIHKKWIAAAELRGLTLKGFISATVSAELIRTGELNPAAECGVTVVTPAPTPAPQPKTGSSWDDEDDDTPAPKSKPKTVEEAIAGWPDDEDDD